MNCDRILTNLNQSQQAAVSSHADTLAILAGPGSGKTHTLTSRTAWLLAQGLQPWNVIVATFTVKAAREMKERIGKLIGDGTESKLILGTFHSISRRYLARYGHLIDIKKGFGIADTTDSVAIIKRIVKRNKYMIDPKVARARISGCKARGAGYKKEEGRPSKKSVDTQEFEQCYEEYEDALRRSNMLDYDDLLLRCVELLRTHPSCVSNVEAVLIDEFQDTNVVQFDLMRLFATARNRITIVGDPDQSIYGFRAAEIKNYKRMLRQYPETITIALEENYRSSGAILRTALDVIEQDDSRVNKSLMPTHVVGTRPVLRKLSGAYKESEWIVTEIQRCKGMTGELLDLNDFAILVRSASLSRLIESALGKAGISYRMVGGLRFYDRVEVKTVLDYLRVTNQPDNNDALARIINTPSRRIGDATIKALLEEADQEKITLWRLILGIVQGRRTTKTQIKKAKDHGLSEIVNIILTGRAKISGPVSERSTISSLIRHILEKTDYENWLKKHHDDVHGARWENVQELIVQSQDFQDLAAGGYEDEALPHLESLQQEESDNYLSRFLANVALASEVKKEDSEESSIAQVTISTIHAAKGLEWPIVFIPGAYQGSIPHSRAEDDDEERRLLYVAMTRAKALLYVSYPLKNSQGEESTLSTFLASRSLGNLLDPKGPSLPSSVVQDVAQILRRPLPSPQSIVKSSLNIKSAEDDSFPLNGEEDVFRDKDLKWKLSQGSQSFTIGQQAQKRRKIELGRSTSSLAEVREIDWKPSYHTTMERATSLTLMPTTTTSGFVSAGSHLQTLNDQSVNHLTGPAHERVKNQDQVKTKGATNPIEGQSTLMSFLGKPQPTAPPKQPKLCSVQQQPSERSRVPYQSSTIATGINERRMPSVTTEPMKLDPSLANHRIGSTTSGIRARPSDDINRVPHKKNEYIFLSSSPPRLETRSPKTKPEADGFSPQGLVSKPVLTPLIRPPSSFHNTSMDMLKGEDNAGGHGAPRKKMLGVRRTVGGQGGTQVLGKFKPPSMRKI